MKGHVKNVEVNMQFLSSALIIVVILVSLIFSGQRFLFAGHKRLFHDY
jgi:hypothetical protein